MKHIKLYEEFLNESETMHDMDFAGMQADAAGMTREEWMAIYGISLPPGAAEVEEAIGGDRKKIKGIRFSYVEPNGRFYKAYLYDVNKTENVSHYLKMGLDDMNALLKTIGITEELPSDYDEKQLDKVCKQLSKKKVACAYDDSMDVS